ncbi:MAG: 50S ribosomal protein L11 methyltransferase [Blastocatellia bacterium]|nr:50S ribosomal protein L11 methyltransferase [Blastocatellia bacterium]
MSDAPIRSEWPFVELDVAAGDAEDVGAALLDLGSTGIEERAVADDRVTVVAWFAAPPELAELANALATARTLDAGVARSAASTLRSGSAPDDDWLRLWKRGFEPTPIGSRLLVFPSWKRDEAMSIPDRVRIEVDPGMAFGTGTHETTRLCLEWIDANWRGGSLLDVGTGTGLLAIAAVLLEPTTRAVACDVDPIAIDVAQENAGLNGIGNAIAFDVCGPEGVDGVFDVVLANLTADVILLVRHALFERTRPGGTLVLSGVLVEQADGVVAEMTALGLLLEWRRDAGEWTGLAMRRP